MTINSGIITSKIQGNKKTILSLSLILILAFSMIMVFAQPTFAQVGISMPEKTTGYIDVSPHLVGVGQEATVNLFIYPIPTNYAYRPYFLGYFGVTVTFVKPDGTQETFMPTDATGQYVAGQTQSLGAIYFFYEPNMAGNWSVSFTMPAQNLTDATGTVLMSGCTSKSTYFTVQADPVLAGLLNGYPWSPLPNANTYWSNPISSNNREWYQISGDWLAGSSSRGPVNGPGQHLWQPYGLGPNTAHIVWTNPFRQGGLIGGDYGSLSYGAQSSNIGSTVMQGKLYINIPNTNPAQFECIDLATGNVLYKMNGAITAGFHAPGNAYTQANLDPSVLLTSSYGHSPTPYLFQYSSGTYNYYDPFTGALLRSIVNASASAQLIDGSEMAYGTYGVTPTPTTGGGYVFAWNLTKVVNNNWPTGIVWQTPLPKPQSINALALFGVSPDASTIVVSGRMNEFYAYSAATGASKWNLTLDYPVMANEAFPMQGVNDFVVFSPTDSTFKCYSMLTGALLWTSTSFNDNSWATTWTVYWSTTNDNENLYAIFPDGTMRAYSLADGHEVWRSTAIASTEYPNNAVPTVNNVILMDGKLYGFAGYTSQYKINPISRFAMLVCIDATNGDTIFTLNGGIRTSSAADGYVIGTGDYDGNLYCLGKGQTSTTVTAQQQVGGSVLIQGSVLDQSAAQPNTPAISDADMSVWMDYLHMQNATLLNSPPNCMGVPVSLSAVDPNGNSVNIGTVTSDGAGHYATAWTPTTAGLYTIYATFAGSNSYFSSYTETSATVATVAAATPVPTQTPLQMPPFEMYTVGTGLAVIIVVIIATLLLLRKRP